MFDKLKNYALITKPGIVLGNLVTGAAGFFLASRGHVDGVVLLATLGGISLVVASGGAFNNCIDREIDRKMLRTRGRAMARGLVKLPNALIFAALLGLAGLALLWKVAPPLALIIVAAGWATYVGVYSMYLKRNSIYGTTIGSLAGAAPPLAGYCAITGSFDLGAMILLAVFSLWQLPHCYAIAVFRSEDYQATAIPVLPLKRGTAAAKNHMAGYIVAFWASAIMLTLAGYTGYGTMAAATALCTVWMFMVWSEYRLKGEQLWAKRLYIFSIATIFLLSVVISIDYAG